MQITRRGKLTRRSYTEVTALNTLKKNENIIIFRADKGNATVIMDRAEYITKMEHLLDDRSYKPAKADPTTYLEKRTKNKIKRSPIDSETQQQIIPREKSSKCPKLYGLTKMHKPWVPLRPIVSTIGCPTQKLAKYLAKQLQPIAETAASHIKNAQHFIEVIN